MRRGVLTAAGSALLVSVLLSGCATTVTGTARPAPTGGIAAGASLGTAAPTAPPGPDATRVRATLLQVDDLPAGWTSEGGDDADSGDMPDLASCLGGRDTSADLLVTGGTPAIEDAQGDAIFSSVSGFTSQADVDGDTALLSDPGASGCLQKALGGLTDPPPEGTTVSGVRATLTPGGAGGPSNVVATGTGTVSLVRDSDRARATLSIDFVFLTGRMTEAELVFMSAGAPLPDSVRSAAVAAVAGRLAAL